MADNQELLSDEGMREFIRKGFITFEADMPAGFHQTVFERTEQVMETSGNPGNNVIAVIPELQEVLDHPRVAGTLSSILGAGYELNANRYCHRRPIGAEAQSPCTMTVSARVTAPAGAWPYTPSYNRCRAFHVVWPGEMATSCVLSVLVSDASDAILDQRSCWGWLYVPRGWVLSDRPPSRQHMHLPLDGTFVP